MRGETWRCFAEYSQGQWIGWCVDLGIGERGDSLEEVRTRLASAVARDRVDTVHPQRSLTGLRVRYGWLRAASALRAHQADGSGTSVRCFDVRSKAPTAARCQVTRNGLRLPGFGWWERVGPWIEARELARWKRHLPNGPDGPDGDQAGAVDRL